MANEVFICLTRTDIGNGSLQVLDLKDNTSQRNFPYSPGAQTKYVNRVQNDTVATTGAGPITTNAAYQGLAAYLIDNVESGGLAAGVAALTAAEANTIATNIIARMDAGNSMSLSDVNTLISATAANSELSNRGGSLSRGTLVELLQILAGREYTLPAGSAVEDATNVLSTTRLGSFTTAQYRETYDTSSLRLSVEQGQLSVYRSATFTHRGATGAGVVIYNRVGAVIPDDSDVILGLDEGYPGVGWISITGVVADTQTVTVNGRVFEFDVINTDSLENTAGGAWNNVTDPLESVTFTGHGRVVGDLVRVNNEIMRVTEVVDANTVSLQRGVSGTTTAVHADAQDIFVSAAGFTGDVAVGLVADLTADAAAAALAADIDDDVATVGVNAETMAGNDDNSSGVLLVTDDVMGTDFALAETLANGTVSAATMSGSTVPTDRTIYQNTYTVTAADVTQFAQAAGANEVIIGAVPGTTAPRLLNLIAYTAAGVILSPNTLTFRWEQISTGFFGLVLEDTGAVLSNTDVINWTAIV